MNQIRDRMLRPPRQDPRYAPFLAARRTLQTETARECPVCRAEARVASTRLQVRWYQCPRGHRFKAIRSPHL